MSQSLILAIDQGTTNTKALLVAQSGKPVFRTSMPMGSIRSEFDHIEQDPLLIWKTVSQVVSDCCQKADELEATIEGIAISNQRETAVAWDTVTGEPLANAIGWQCPRSARICDRLQANAPLIRERTGLPLSTLLTAGKWAWLLEEVPEVRARASDGKLRFGTVDSWIIHKLTEGTLHITDLTNASRTGLLNLNALCWDDELLEMFYIPGSALPTLHPSSGIFAKCTGIPGIVNVPIVSAIGDSHAALVGHGSYASGTVKATYGTGSSLMSLTPMLVGETSALARTVAWSIGGDAQYALEGNISMTGATVQWAGGFLGLPNPTEDIVTLASTVTDSDGVYLVPAMSGLGAPYWDSKARGVVTGLGRSHTAAHLAHAAIDSIAYQVADVFFAMQEIAGVRFQRLLTDGGASRNSALMQFQADLLGCPVVRSSEEELSALGAAWLGGLALGWWQSLQELEATRKSAKVFTPGIESASRECRYQGWRNAVRCARLRAVEAE